MHRLQSYEQGEPVFDTNAHTISSIIPGGTLKMFTSHPSQPTSPEDRPEYYMNRLRSFAMADTAETYRQGATYFRNARDWTREQGHAAIGLANERAGESQVGTLAVTQVLGKPLVSQVKLQ